METLLDAIRTNDAAQLEAALSQHPEWRETLNQPLPGGPFGATALLCALQRRNRDMIDVLLRAGADINARSDWWAGSFGVLDNPTGLEDFLIERGARVDAHAAARLGMLDRLKELIASDPSLVHARGGDGQTPLHFAASVEIAEYLLAQGADIDAIDIDHESTPAQYMARERQEVARYLVSRGCRTDLLMAAALGDVALAGRHLDADPASIRMTVSEEWFPKRNPRAGGTIYIWVLGWNKLAHNVARDFKHPAIFHLLMDHSPESLRLAVSLELGDKAPVPSNVAEFLEPPDLRRLASAAQANNVAAVARMLAHGWPVGAAAPEGATALHWAGFHGNLEMARVLLRHGAPLEIEEDTFHGTPLGWTLYGSVHGWYCKTGDYAGVVRALLDAGAKRPEAVETASDAVRAALE